MTVPNEIDPNLDPNLNGNPNLEGGSGGGGEGEELPPQTYLRDLTEDDVYDRLSRVTEFQPQLSALESRLNGGVNSLTERLASIEKGLPTQAAFDTEKVIKGLEAYDPKLAEVLGPLLQDAFKVNPLDENTLRPHLEPIQQQLQETFGRELVMSVYSPETLSEIIPEVKDGRFMPEGQRQKDFADWYAQQGYETQQALLRFGAPYVNALRKFERWEKDRNTSRAAAAATKEGQLQKGQVPAGQHRTQPPQKKLTPDEEFAAGFNEIAEVK